MSKDALLTDEQVMSAISRLLSIDGGADKESGRLAANAQHAQTAAWYMKNVVGPLEKIVQYAVDYECFSGYRINKESEDALATAAQVRAELEE